MNFLREYFEGRSQKVTEISGELMSHCIDVSNPFLKVRLETDEVYKMHCSSVNTMVAFSVLDLERRGYRGIAGARLTLENLNEMEMHLR